MRQISTSFRNEIEASSSSGLLLVFATITHASFTEDVRIVAEDQKGCSFYNGQIVNYRYGGDLFLGCPFAITLLSDDERPPRAQIVIPDPSRRLGLAVLALTDSPMITFEVLKLSDFSSAIDADNARNPVGTPVVEYSATELYLRNVRGDVLQVEAQLSTYDVIGEPWPYIRSVKSVLPGLFR